MDLVREQEQALLSGATAPARPAPVARRAPLLSEALFARDQKRYLRHLKHVLTLPENHPDRLAAADVARERMILAGILGPDGNLTELYRE
ncbi:MAG: hypothetical protein LBK75_10730 [Oscillospiraceae bacterium]|nr:hypothetical protein [Oscillospiraceae bacterium]